jgi:predicted MPP superfamily phosphohydrolase
MNKIRLVLILWLFAITITFATQPLKIAHITDVHFLSSSLVDEGDAYNNFVRATGRNTADLHEVLNVVLTDLINEKIDILLISGDITNHGEQQSHLDFIEKLRPLKAQGTRVFVVPGNHDINVPTARAFIGNTSAPVQTISAEGFTQLYADFGYSEALKKDTHSLSYLTVINDSVWLLAFDTNRYAEYTTQTISSGRILPQTLAWALDILQKAEEKGIIVLGMMHHNIVEHIPLQATFFADYLIDDWQQIAEIFADAGLKVVFTGHFHTNSVSLRTSIAGNTIYDVQTASLAQYPFAYRIMDLKSNELHIDTRFVASIPRNFNLEATYRQKLTEITRRTAQNRLRTLGMPIPEMMQNVLTDVIVNLNLLHVRGDGTPNNELLQFIRTFAGLLGNEIDTSEFNFDFPPANNQLTIRLKD